MRQKLSGTIAIVLSLSTMFAATAMAAKKSTVAKEALMIELTGKDPSKVDETTLYSEIVASYRKNDEIGFKSRLQTFRTRFSNSQFADNVLYLAGRMAFNNKNYGEAIKYYQRVVNQYPRSNKVVAASLAKGVAYRKMNLTPQANYVFKDLRKKYPGSPESFRAENELKMNK
jgi:TolA-binding protein